MAAMLEGIDTPSEPVELSVDLVELAAHPAPPPDEARVPEVSVAHSEDDPVAHQSDMDIVSKDIPLPSETHPVVDLGDIPLPPSRDCEVPETNEPVLVRDEGQEEELPKTQQISLPLGTEMQGPLVDVPVLQVPVDQLETLPLPPPNYLVTPFGKVHADYVPSITKK